MAKITISEGLEVTAHFTMHDDEGQLVASSADDGPMVFIQGQGKVLRAIEDAVTGRTIGDRLAIEVPPEGAFGAHRPELVFEAPRNNLPLGLAVRPGEALYSGMGDRPRFQLRVLKETDNGYLLDGNHPLAGRTLSIALDIVDVRRRTAMEIAINAPLRDPNGR